jgi:hypothetical protein
MWLLIFTRGLSSSRRENVMTPDGQHNAMAQPTARGRLWNWVLHIVGVILAIGGGIALWYLLVVIDVQLREQDLVLPVWLDILAFIVFAAWAALAAALLRTWWSLLIVSVAFYAGILLAVAGFDLQQVLSNGLLAAWTVLILALPAAALGAAFGTYLGMRVEESIRR